MNFDFDQETSPLPNIGLVVLQTDETIEQDFRQLFPSDRVNLYVTRIPSGDEVTRESLAQMEIDLPRAVSLLPKDIDFDAIGYGCTSGASVIGSERIGDLCRSNASVGPVTDPVRALLAACSDLNVTRLAFLSPYIESVSQGLRDVLDENRVKTPIFGSFNEADDATVAKIARASLVEAARKLAQTGDVDALFMSCTNLKTLNLIEELEEDLGMPVLSSNLVLAKHLADLSRISIDFRSALTGSD